MIKKEWTSCFNEKTYFAPDQRTYVFPAGVIHAHAFMSTSASHKSSYDPSWLIVTDWWGIDTFDCTPENGEILLIDYYGIINWLSRNIKLDHGNAFINSKRIPYFKMTMIIWRCNSVLSYVLISWTTNNYVFTFFLKWLYIKQYKHMHLV